MKNGDNKGPRISQATSRHISCDHSDESCPGGCDSGHPGPIHDPSVPGAFTPGVAWGGSSGEALDLSHCFARQRRGHRKLMP